MGSVYKAIHARFKEVRAIKVISPDLAGDANFVGRFEQEAVVTRKLQHPNAVRIEDIDEADDGRPFIVMEYIEGRGLKDVIEQEAPLPVARVGSSPGEALQKAGNSQSTPPPVTGRRSRFSDLFGHPYQPEKLPPTQVPDTEARVLPAFPKDGARRQRLTIWRKEVLMPAIFLFWLSCRTWLNELIG